MRCFLLISFIILAHSAICQPKEQNDCQVLYKALGMKFVNDNFHLSTTEDSSIVIIDTLRNYLTCDFNKIFDKTIIIDSTNGRKFDINRETNDEKPNIVIVYAGFKNERYLIQLYSPYSNGQILLEYKKSIFGYKLKVVHHGVY